MAMLNNQRLILEVTYPMLWILDRSILSGIAPGTSIDFSVVETVDQKSLRFNGDPGTVRCEAVLGGQSPQNFQAMTSGRMIVMGKMVENRSHKRNFMCFSAEVLT